MHLEATRAALCVPEDDVRVGHVLKGDAAGFLETGTRGIEQVNDRAAPTMHSQRLLPENRQLLDRERAGNRPLQGTDPRDVERLPKVHPEMPDEPSPSVAESPPRTFR